MDTIEFCKLAVASKTWNRPVLESVYRDVDKFVATDGHRLHWCNSQPHIEKPYLLSGQDYEYPDYKQAFPRNLNPVAKFTLSKKEIRSLKLFCDLLASFNDKRDQPIGGKITMGLTSISFRSDRCDAYHLELKFHANVFMECGISLNLRYFYEAVSMWADQPISLQFDNPNAPIQLDGPENCHALIMPMRILES